MGLEAGTCTETPKGFGAANGDDGDRELRTGERKGGVVQYLTKREFFRDTPQNDRLQF